MARIMRVVLLAGTVVALVVSTALPAAAGNRTIRSMFTGGNAMMVGDELHTSPVPIGSCQPTYCYRVKAGRRDRLVTVTVRDYGASGVVVGQKVGVDVLFAVGQDENGDGDAIDAGEYGLFCGTGTIAIKPRKNVDIQLLGGVHVFDGPLICSSAPYYGELTVTLKG